VKLDRDLNTAPALAESWTYSRDCLELTFKLRRDVKWHDGHPFTADDVVFTYQTMINPKTPAPFKEGFLLVKDVQAPDPYTVRVTYDKPYARAIETWGTYVLPKHLLQSFATAGTLRESPQNSYPIGTGPYRFQEWKPGEKVVLVASPDYYEGRPYLSRIVYRVIPSQATIFLELKAKGVDYVSTLTGIQYARQTEYPAFRKAYHKFRYPASDYTFLGFNLRDPWSASPTTPRRPRPCSRRRAGRTGTATASWRTGRASPSRSPSGPTRATTSGRRSRRSSSSGSRRSASTRRSSSSSGPPSSRSS
jgi:peptide/nickel transport system substrate-binding protein